MAEPRSTPATVAPHRNRLKLVAFSILIAALALTAAWRWTPLHDFAEPRAVAHELRLLLTGHSAWAPVIIIGIYILSNAVMFPNTVLCFATILALGTVKGFAYATGGSLIAAVAAYAVGRYWGPERIRQMQIHSLERLSVALRRGGVVQITMLRLLPLAPFSVVNLVAGAAHVRVVPFVVGTFLGLLPGNLLMTAFGRQLRRIVANPTPTEIAITVAVAIVGSVVIWQLQRLAAAAETRHRT
jgi:phospholipase D1/2